jgi:hypothetical protein
MNVEIGNEATQFLSFLAAFKIKKSRGICGACTFAILCWSLFCVKGWHKHGMAVLIP